MYIGELKESSFADCTRAYLIVIDEPADLDGVVLRWFPDHGVHLKLRHVDARRTRPAFVFGELASRAAFSPIGGVNSRRLGGLAQFNQFNLLCRSRFLGWW
jgi:hypothetical protein